MTRKLRKILDDMKDVVRVVLDDIVKQIKNLFVNRTIIMMDYKVSRKREQIINDTFKNTNRSINPNNEFN